jgi:hypothetical protein
MYILDNIKVSERDQRTIGTTQYPPDWFLDPLEREKVGMTEVPDIPMPDDNLYTSVENPDGSWTATPRTAADIAERLATVTKDAENNVRATRNELLAATDWTASSDVTMSTAMKAYRQALRDVPTQAGFPNDITWPEKPE